LAARVAQGVVVQTGEHFLHVPNADGSPSGGLKGGTAGEVEVEAVFEALPFFVGEEVAECRVPVRDLLLLGR
jgi:hypothetical protein